MNLTRLSLFYLAGYLVPAGLMLMFVPELALKLLFTTGSYGDLLPRLTGGLAFALGIVVVQIIRHRVDALYTTTMAVRALLLGLLAWLFVRSSDPLFIVLFGVVGLGVAITGTAALLDGRRNAPRVPATNRVQLNPNPRS